MLKMKRQPRIYYTETDKALMLDRWKKGEHKESHLNSPITLLLFDYSKRNWVLMTAPSEITLR